MTLALLAVVFGLALLVWSADRFVEGASATARHFDVPPLLIGMVVVGFGTSAPEMVVSAFAALQGNPGIALGNAYGSNITNIALILGVTAMISPIAVQSSVLRKELPILTAVTALAAFQLWDSRLTRFEACVLFAVFAGVMGWTIYEGLRGRADTFGGEMEVELVAHPMPLNRALFWLVAGVVLLVGASRLLVWGAVAIAQDLGVSDLVIGLTVVAIGTSLPELASSVMAAHKQEHDIALGNVIGSNLFNTLPVVAIAGVIHPMTVAPEVLTRDILTMSVLTVSLFILGTSWSGPGRITRGEAAVLLVVYIGYTGYLIRTAFLQIS